MWINIGAVLALALLVHTARECESRGSRHVSPGLLSCSATLLSAHKAKQDKKDIRAIDNVQDLGGARDRRESMRVRERGKKGVRKTMNRRVRAGGGDKGWRK